MKNAANFAAGMEILLMKTRIVVDSAASLYALDGVDFACVPLKIITDHEEYHDDGTLDAVGMATTLRTYKGKTSTSCPNVGDWLAAYEGADDPECGACSRPLSKRRTTFCSRRRTPVPAVLWQ